MLRTVALVASTAPTQPMMDADGCPLPVNVGKGGSAHDRFHDLATSHAAIAMATIRPRGVITIDVSADDWIAQQEVSAPTGAPRLRRHDRGPSSLVGTDRAPRSVHVGVLALRHERR